MTDVVSRRCNFEVSVTNKQTKKNRRKEGNRAVLYSSTEMGGFNLYEPKYLSTYGILSLILRKNPMSSIRGVPKARMGSQKHLVPPLYVAHVSYSTSKSK